MLSVCLWVPPNNFWMPELIFMKLGMYIMAPEPIASVCFINPSHQSVCMCVCLYPLIVAGQRLGKNVTAAVNTHNSRRIVGCVFFCAVRVISKESRRLFFPELLAFDEVHVYLLISFFLCEFSGWYWACVFVWNYLKKKEHLVLALISI
jgi:hypothetical protein